MKIKLLIIALVISLFTACESSDKANTTTTTTSVEESKDNNVSTTVSDNAEQTSTTTTEVPVADVPPYYWVCNEKIHYASGQAGRTKNTVLYSGTLDDFDDAILDGYELKGELYSSEKLTGFDKNELEAFGFKDGTEVYYNAEENSYILKDAKDDNHLSIAEHICNANCLKTAD